MAETTSRVESGSTAMVPPCLSTADELKTVSDGVAPAQAVPPLSIVESEQDFIARMEASFAERLSAAAKSNALAAVPQPADGAVPAGEPAADASKVTTGGVAPAPQLDRVHTGSGTDDAKRTHRAANSEAHATESVSSPRSFLPPDPPRPSRRAFRALNALLGILALAGWGLWAYTLHDATTLQEKVSYNSTAHQQRQPDAYTAGNPNESRAHRSPTLEKTEPRQTSDELTGKRERLRAELPSSKRQNAAQDTIATSSLGTPQLSLLNSGSPSEKDAKTPLTKKAEAAKDRTAAAPDENGDLVAGTIPSSGAGVEDRVTELSRSSTARVFIHYVAQDRDSNRRADRLASYLQSRGYEVAALRPVDFSVRSNVVRFFHEEDSAAAVDIMAQVRESREATRVVVQDFRSFPRPPRRGNVEIWLAGSS